MSELVYATHPDGSQSKRSYTRAELAAARRQGFLNKKGLGGPMFWAMGDWWPNAARQAAKDYAIINAAIEREWAKEGDQK